MMTSDILKKPEAQVFDELKALGFSDARAALRNLQLLSDSPAKGLVDQILSEAALSASPDGALNNLETIVKELPGDLLASLDLGSIKALVRVCAASPFLSGIMARNPDHIKWLFREGGISTTKNFEVFRAELQGPADNASTVEGMSKALRLLRQREYLRIGSRDLLGLSPVEEVTAEIADLASACLDASVYFASRELKKTYGATLYTDIDGDIKEAEFTVIGMGKLGGRELNFSSDIDIIYIYSSDKGETSGVDAKESSRISLHAFFIKLSMMVNKLIGAPTEDGFVFRVDLDLRPEGRSGDMANSLRSAEIYYESWGQSWERAAMIKARPVAGSMRLGENFLSMIRPFVFRRYLDFTAIEEIKSMKEKIDLSLLRRNPDAIDVKLGVGGIREIEFFCQALQLIHGGKDAEIREKNTLNAIKKLLARGYVREDEAKTLTEGYRFLRNLEHRIQIIECRQTQAIPLKTAELERIARMMGFATAGGKTAGEALLEEYRSITAGVHEIYRSLFYKPDEEKEVPDDVLALFAPEITGEEARLRLLRLGFKDPETAWRNLSLIRTGPAFLHLSAKARLLLQKLAPLFLYRASRSPDGDMALQHLERFISSVGARTTFYSLLAENPLVRDELIKLFGTSVFLSRDLIEHPESLDLLLSKELSIPYKKKEEMMEEFLEELDRAGDDYEESLESVRRIKNQEVFRIGINSILGRLNARQVSIQITFLAEAAIDAAYNVAFRELSKTCGTPPEKAVFTVIGLGKLGSRELIFGSDLDIIFVYEDSSNGFTTGAKSISSHEFFVKLGQRMISVLTLKTKEGHVFNVDTRLRPSGSAGPLVISREAFLNYHRDKTQVWERQAFTRARAAGGSLEFGSAILKDLEEILYEKPLTTHDIEEMIRIRGRMETEIAKETPSRYNIKTGRGALVDIEFLVQALQLKYGQTKKGLRTPNTLKALKRLSSESIISTDDYGSLKSAYTFYRAMEMQLRVVHDRPEGNLIAGTEELKNLARRLGYPEDGNGMKLLEDYKKYSERVRSIYMKGLESIRG